GIIWSTQGVVRVRKSLSIQIEVANLYNLRSPWSPIFAMYGYILLSPQASLFVRLDVYFVIILIKPSCYVKLYNNHADKHLILSLKQNNTGVKNISNSFIKSLPIKFALKNIYLHLMIKIKLFQKIIVIGLEIFEHKGDPCFNINHKKQLAKSYEYANQHVIHQSSPKYHSSSP
ncbi:hypothetical protein ACJX0J_014054, partial [Zea mays]